MKDDEYEVVIARHGTRTGLRSEAFLNYASTHETDGPIVTDYFVWVIRNDVRTIFVDTGFAEAAARRRGREVVLPTTEIYRLLDVDPGAGWPVIITHAHWDHVGNLDLFPLSTFWMSRKELTFWSTDVSRAPQIAHFAEADEIELMLELNARGRMTTFDDSADVAPGIRVERVGGHTPGQTMVRVNTAQGVVLLTSDAAHFREELDDERPFIALTDLPGCIEAYRRIKHLRDRGEIQFVVTGHDPMEREHGRRIHPEIAIIGEGA